MDGRLQGLWRTTNGDRADPLTVRDAWSRYVLELRLMRRTDYKATREVFEELFEKFGIPKAIQSDNGPPFASTRALAGLTKLSAWWLSLGIEVVRSRPGKPTDNGGHERMHYTACTCAASDPCGWIEDGVCDSICTANFPTDHLDDFTDCAAACTSDCTGAVYSACSCSSVDPCNWAGDGVCDAACSYTYPADHFHDPEDCP